MILQSLVQYYETLAEKGKITKPGWSNAKISFALELSPEGQLIRVISMKTEQPKGKKMVWEAQTMMVPQQVTRSSGKSANFLCDNSSYFLGIDNKGKPERAKECFQCAKDKHLEILKETDTMEAKAVIQFFEAWNPDLTEENPVLAEALEEIKAGANLIFQVGGQYVHQMNEVKAAWEKYFGDSEEGPEGICLVTGKRANISRIHRTIKGVQGAQSSGAALVSFNAPAFESYGKEQSFNAPVGNYAAYAYTTALNHLIADRKHTTTIGETTIVYWSEDGEEVCQDIFSETWEPTADNYEIVQGVFENLRKGKGVNIPGIYENISLTQRFYVLGLTPNAARIAVRFFYQDSFGNILRYLKEHYDRMEIVRSAKDLNPYLGTWRMLSETVNKNSKDKKPASNMAGAVLQSILSGSPYPYSLYQAVLGRIRADQDNSDRRIYKITRGRAAIIKAFLLRNGNVNKEDITMALNEESKHVAYTLGREFAVLEAIQEDANPGLNATIKDRYFNAACATPAAIFPILFKLKNSHARKLNSKGIEIYYEKLLGELQDKLTVTDDSVSSYPKRLSLEEQGMFILGYYHQNQKRYEKKTKEEK